MRILRLDLTAYGPFTGASLDFAAPERGLHVVYGDNEAGKSSALRAVGGLFYGIAHGTKDDHLHAKGALRVGATLQRADGREISFVRRKGLKGTLLDPTGAALDDAALEAFLGGVDAGMFARMFGLDHERLREAGHALAAGHGEIGESIFGAGLGGTGIRGVLAALKADTERVYKPTGKLSSLNRALADYGTAHRRIAETSLSATSWEATRRSLDSAKAQRDAVATSERELRARQSRLARAKRALPLLAELDAARAARAALGDVVVLPASAGHDRELAEHRLLEARRQAAAFGREIADLESRREALSVPDALLDCLPEIKQLTERLGSTRKAGIDLPRLRAELRRAAESAESVLAQLGRPVSTAGLGDVDLATLRVGVAEQAEIRRLALTRAALEQKVAVTHASLADKVAVFALAREELAGLPPPASSDGVRALRAALSHVREEGNVDRSLRARDERVTKATDAARAALHALGVPLLAPQRGGHGGPHRDGTSRSDGFQPELPFPRATDFRTGATAGSIDHDFAVAIANAPTLAVPSPETITRFVEDVAAIDREARDLVVKFDDLAKARARSTRELDELRASGSVPTEAELDVARAERDAAWTRVKQAWSSGAPSDVRPPEGDVEAGARAFLLDDFEARVRHADQLADRLRRESDRVARLAGLVAKRHEEDTLAAALDERGLYNAERRGELELEWARAWAQSGIAPSTPSEMLGWRSRLGELLARVRELRDAERDRDAVVRVRGDLHASLVAALAGVTVSADGGTASSLSELVGRAEDALAAVDDEARRAATVATSVAGLSEEIDRLQRQAMADERALAAWGEKWSGAVAAIGLSGEASCEQATAVLDKRSELLSLLEKEQDLRRRVHGIERDALAFAQEVARLAATHAPERAGEGPELVAEWLIARATKGLVDREARTAIDQQLADRRRALADANDTCRVLDERLRALMEAAGCIDVSALRVAEERSKTARERDAAIAALEHSLFGAGDGASIAEIAGETRGLAIDDVAAELTDVGRRLDALERERGEHERAIGKIEQQLAAMDGGGDAAMAAAEAQDHLAKIRSDVDRYVRLRLATTLLERAIDRYREQSQGPILRRAGEIFERLTLGRYERLRTEVDDDDRAVLRCVREGKGVPVGALSDGTRDQLFLALRVASLERFLERNEPVPVVVDDILIHFDDARAKAGIEVLGDLARRTQVLLFTHHARVVELVERALPAETWRRHGLAWQ